MNSTIYKTYMNLRKGIVFLTILLPIILIVYGIIIDVDIQNSLSSYYHAFPEAFSYNDFHTIQKGQFLRTFFVGLLFAVGSLLYLYKGFCSKENIALNLAGIFAVMVALFPMQWPDSGSNVIFEAIKFGDKMSLHGISAVLLVFCVAYVCIFRPSKTVNLIDDEKRRSMYIRTYNILGALMIFLPIFVFVYLSILGKNDKVVLWVEIAVLVVFAIFWWIKSKELSEIGDEKLMKYSEAYFNSI